MASGKTKASKRDVSPVNIYPQNTSYMDQSIVENTDQRAYTLENKKTLPVPTTQ
jgi:hypothetical protein